jgi:hypothetical protein
MNERKAPEPTFEIPDLELAPPVSRRPAPTAAARAPTAALAPEAATFGLEIALPDLDDDLLQTGPSVALSVEVSPAAVRRQEERWPHGHTRPADQLPIDPAEVTLLAGYGELPGNALVAPAYAYRVLSRRGPLKQTVKALNAELTLAELARDTQLMQLSHELRDAIEANDAFRRLLEPIREVERLAGERHAALSAADAGYREQMARFDAELARLHEAEAQAQAVQDEKARICEGTESQLRRAEAKHQRVQIEIRGVLDVARQAVGPAGGDMPPEQATRLAELQARAEALAPELAAAKSAHAAASAAQEQAQADARRLQSQRRGIEKQKANAGGTLQKQLDVRAQSASEADQQRRDALAEVARAVLAARGAVEVPQPLLQALREHDAKVEALAIRLETHVRALDSYDRQRLKQGIIVALSLLGVVLLSILLKAML